MTEKFGHITVRGMYAATYRVKAKVTEQPEVEQVVSAVSSDHAIKILLTDYLEVFEWPSEFQALFFSIATKDLFRMVDGLTFSCEYLGKNPHPEVAA